LRPRFGDDEWSGNEEQGRAARANVLVCRDCDAVVRWED
jgi:hypothetical protein